MNMVVRNSRESLAKQAGSALPFLVVIIVLAFGAGIVLLTMAVQGYKTQDVAQLTSELEAFKTAQEQQDKKTDTALTAIQEDLQGVAIDNPDNPTSSPAEPGTDPSTGEETTACAYGPCVSLQATATGTQETGGINISRNARIAGVVTASSFSGSGANLSSLNASSLNSGTLADGRLSSNVALLGANQTFAGQLQLTYAGTALTVTNAVSIGTLTVVGGASVGGSLAVTGSVTASSYAKSCPTGYIPVPGNPKYGTTDFCVMKYEAKDSSGAVSTAGDTPWTSITQYDAQAEAQAAGGHLLTEAEWMTIATNVLMQPENWCALNGTGCSNTPGTGGTYLSAGHNDASPNQALEATTDDADVCYGTVTAGVSTACGAAGTQRRTLTLSNGSVIWDFAGNAWEWTDAWIMGSEQPAVVSPSFAWRDFTSIIYWGPMAYANPTNRGWNSSQRLGQIYSSGAQSDASLFGVLRGGNWGATTHAGAFGMELDAVPSTSAATIGFRVAR